MLTPEDVSRLATLTRLLDEAVAHEHELYQYGKSSDGLVRLMSMSPATSHDQTARGWILELRTVASRTNIFATTQDALDFVQKYHSETTALTPADVEKSFSW